VQSRALQNRHPRSRGVDVVPDLPELTRRKNMEKTLMVEKLEEGPE
jgi:hypothetical protein